MAITPLGNSTFVNQNAALPSVQASNELAKESFAAMANLAEFQAKDKSVERIDKATPSDEVQEEIKERADEEKGGKKREGEENESGEEKAATQASEEKSGEQASIHRLDISI